MSRGAVLYMAVLGWLTGLLYVLRNRKQFVQNINPIILLAMVDLPLEIGLITISGRSILHYYLTPLPVMALLSGILVYLLSALVRKVPFFSSLQARNTISVLALLSILFFQVTQIWNYPVYIENEANNIYTPLIDYVVNNTNQDDLVLVLGAESVVNFLSRREAPTRFVYQYPLQLLGRRYMFEEYFNDIIQRNPVLIISAPGSNPLDENLYKPMQSRSSIVREGVKYLIQNYRQSASFGEWIVYQYTGTP
jgi:hypothetical protein